MSEKTFLTVEKQNTDGNWTVIATDASFETRQVGFYVVEDGSKEIAQV